MSVQASHGNHRAFWRHFARACGGESREIPGGLLIRCGVPGSGWNHLHLDTGPDQEAALEQALEFFAGHGVGWRIFAEGESPVVDGFAARLGAAAQPVYPILNRAGGPAGDPDPGPLHLSTAASPADLREFLDCAADAYGFGAALLAPLAGPRAFEDPALRFHLGRLDGRVVAISAGVHHEDTVGVYFVGVRTGHRRRGFGRAVTAHAIDAVPQAGLAVLQATPAGLNVYRAMGFRTVAEYRYWNIT